MGLTLEDDSITLDFHWQILISRKILQFPHWVLGLTLEDDSVRLDFQWQILISRKILQFNTLAWVYLRLFFRESMRFLCSL